MINIKTSLAIAGTAVLLSTTALAQNLTIKTLPDSGTVSITGTVDKVKNEKRFVLRDNSGTISVDIESNKPILLQKGQTVRVSGYIDKHLMGKDINATSVEVQSNPPQDTTASTGGDVDTPDRASEFSIANLPQSGAVKVSGLIQDLNNEKNFTLQDDTGKIDVNIQEAEISTSLSNSTKVVVFGYVENGLTGRKIKATKVLVNSLSHM
ncbi:MAG: Bacterial fold protein [Rickettsiaceae bacterium]|jgi:uncharacterized protein YdeI (BOF family)|nr:Bacterial fold protein [Rickettsiaceae bacterium]